jgi:hypothetical protein
MTLSLLDLSDDQRKRTLELAFCPGAGPADNSCSSREGGGGEPRDRIREKLSDDAVKLKWGRSTEDYNGDSDEGYGRTTAEFRTPSGRKFEVQFDEEYFGGAGIIDRVEIMFGDNNYSHEATGAGEAFHVFKGVGKAVAEYIERQAPEEISFGAHGASRIKLYDRLAKAIKQMFPSYKLSEWDRSAPDHKSWSLEYNADGDD